MSGKRGVTDKEYRLKQERAAVINNDRRVIKRAESRNGYMRAYAADLLTRIIAHTDNLNGPEGGGFFNGLLTVDDLEEIVNRLRAGIPDADLLKFEETKEPIPHA